MSKWLKRTSLVISAFVLAVVLVKQWHTSHSQSALERLMQQHQGKVIYLDFWASWCTPCRQSFPWMNKMNADYLAQGLVILSVNLDSQRELANKFLKATPASFPIVYDDTGVIAKQFNVKAMPSSYLFNRQGNLVTSHQGYNQQIQVKFEQAIKQQLQQP